MYTRLTKAIKEIGYGPKDFSMKFLGLKYATFNYRVRVGRLSLDDYHKILFHTGKRFEDLFPNPLRPRMAESQTISRQPYPDYYPPNPFERLPQKLGPTVDQLFPLPPDFVEVKDVIEKRFHSGIPAFVDSVKSVIKDAPPVIPVEPPREPAPAVTPTPAPVKKFKAKDLRVPIVEPGEPMLEIPVNVIRPGIPLPDLDESASLQ